MSSRKKVLLKVIILGDSKYVSLPTTHSRGGYPAYAIAIVAEENGASSADAKM